MNLDDRLEALVRSAEARDRQIEASNRQIEASNRQIEAHSRQLEALLELAAKNDADIAKLATKQHGDNARLEKLVTEIAEGTARLLHTAELHQHRLDSHNDRLDNLESQ
jgi:chromosome segregation ATPase